MSRRRPETHAPEKPGRPAPPSREDVERALDAVLDAVVPKRLPSPKRPRPKPARKGPGTR